MLWFPRSETSVAFKNRQSSSQSPRQTPFGFGERWADLTGRPPQKTLNETLKRDAGLSRMFLSNSWWAAVDRAERSFSDCSLNLNTPKSHSSGKQDQSCVFGVSDDSIGDKWLRNPSAYEDAWQLLTRPRVSEKLLLSLKIIEVFF